MFGQNSILSPSSPQASSAAKARGLLLKGQFPVAKLGTADFEELIGLPPLVPARHSRSYGLFLLLNTMAPEFQCPSCKCDRPASIIVRDLLMRLG